MSGASKRVSNKQTQRQRLLLSGRATAGQLALASKGAAAA
jgi:hypothetical protein